ncbi:MAG: glycosyltransferase family 39 protein [Phycisphaeraceae bacterium]|nr:MAG: glycosyltransferase family 39 protein [Phycisphaeraceae bacterium]
MRGREATIPAGDLGPVPWCGWASAWRATVALVLAVTLARLAYLAWGCPYTLIEDEAHYWEWSRRLDWSYYSKGPGVAWLIAASTRVFGVGEFAVRFPAVIAAAVMTLSVAGLVRRSSGDGRAGFFAAACVLLTPAFQSTSLLMTIDMPYAACWAVAAWAGWRAMTGGSARWWFVLGLAVGVGFLFKYTILLLVPGLVGFAWAWRRSAGVSVGAGGVGLAASVALLGLIPVAVWNAQRDWPTVRHLLGHLGMRGGDVPMAGDSGGWGYSPWWTIEFIGSQAALVGPVLALALLGMTRRWFGVSTPGREGADRLARAYLVWCAGPILVFYVLVSFVAEPEGNWAVAAYVTLSGLAGWTAVRGMDAWRERVSAWRALPEPRPRAGVLLTRPESPVQVAWHASVVFGVVAGAAILRLDLVARLPGLERVVPLSRFMGADVMAADVARLIEEARRESGGLEPFVVSQFYGRAGQMAFYLPGRPVVYCSGSRMGGRRTQYDYWSETDLADASLAGRPAVMLGDAGIDWSWGFDRVEPRGRLSGDRKRQREAFLGFGYRPR